MQELIGQGQRELGGVFGHVVGTEGLDRIIIFVISCIYLTVCREASASRCSGNLCLGVFPVS